MVSSCAPKCVILAMIALACLGADEFRATPKFTGRSIPDPPRQKESWTPPRTKLPRFLVTATAALFERGMADPRGGEYREVEIGDDSIVRTRGFVLPPKEAEAGRFVISWDGIVYPALSVGAATDLDGDIRTLAESMRRARADAAAGKRTRSDAPAGFGSAISRGRMFGQSGPATPDSHSPLRLCLLLRLGRADLAEDLFQAGTTWTPDGPSPDLTDYAISYLTLATDWSTAVFLRLVDAHGRGDDAIALDAARRLTRFEAAVETRAEEMGIQRRQARFGEAPSYLPLLFQLPELLADQERRAKEPQRGPIPPRGGDPTARVAALIRDLDQVGQSQMTHWGNSTAGSRLGEALVAEGDPAVEPLLAALETDMRLTRTVTRGRGGSPDRFVHPVVEIEIEVLTKILQTSQVPYTTVRNQYRDLGSRKLLARSLRDQWRKNRAIPANERWYGMLRDDAAGPQRWAEAMSRIVQPKDSRAPMGVGAFRMERPARSPMAGEELRARQNPSVSELMARRIPQIARSTEAYSLNNACAMAMIFDRWDEHAALPTIREMTDRCLEKLEGDRGRNHGVSLDEVIANHVAGFTLIRARSGDREALRDYAAWARRSGPEELKVRVMESFEPLWRFPDDPAIRDATRWLFNDPASPWVPLLRAPGNDSNSLFHHHNIYSSPLAATAGFRAGLLAALGVRSPMGTIRRGDHRTLGYRTEKGWGENFQPNPDELEMVKPGASLPFRVCDFIAWKVSSIEGSPRCELYWPEDRRDGGVQACAEYLRKYGGRLTADAPPGTHDFPAKKAHLAFPTLDRPATPDDVRSARAVFSLAGQGEVRTVKVRAFPVTARWLALKDTPITLQKGDGTTYRDYDQDGFLWQAEEVRRGDRWERSFGFVGHHVIERVPAEEVELANVFNTWGRLPGGLDARIEPAESSRTAFEPGQPVDMIVRIRNRRGLDGMAPTDFLRRAGDGRPSLRRGVSIELYFSPVNPTGGGPAAGIPREPVPPKRTDRFDPGAESRPLSAFETFDAMPIDLADWFDLSRPGAYRVRVAFAADSGIGPGTSNDWYFTIGEGP